ncbi:MAG: TonB-dependent receptor [Gemmatimonas sp.]
MGTTNTSFQRALAAAVVALLVLPAQLLAQAGSQTNEETLLLGALPSVFGASRFDQAVTEAPAAVSVITADEIAAYGWQTLSDLLRSVRGFYTTYDRSYASLGTRGFARAGDYNSRVLLLRDGVRLNENVFGAAAIAMDGLVDLSAVERVEIIRGPASSLYGTNAFFGIINVIMQRGRAHPGVNASIQAGSFGAVGATLKAAGRTRDRIEYLGTATRYDSKGQDLYFAEFDTPASNHGMAVSRDKEVRNTFFGKLQRSAVAIEGAINQREKTIPTASYGSKFNEDRMQVSDHLANVAVRYQPDGNETSNLSASLSVSRYDFVARVPWADFSIVQSAHGQWGVGEAQYARQLAGLHRIVIGGSFTHNWKLEELLALGGLPPVTLLDNRNDDTRALYTLGEFRLGRRIILNGGLRYDHTPSTGDSWTPRGAFIFKTAEGSALKVLYGNAFRAPNSFEQYYDDGITQKSNTALTPEHVNTLELLAEQLVSPHLKLTASMYRYQARDLIDVSIDTTDGMLRYQNVGRVNGEGIEAEAEVDYSRITGRASYAIQQAWSPPASTQISNSPQHVAALNAIVPIVAERARLGIELQGMSSRRTVRGDLVPAHLVSNAVLSGKHVIRNAQFSFGVFNVFNAKFSDPAGPQFVQRVIAQDGRSLRLNVGYVF